MHKNKHIRDAIEYAIERGWQYIRASGRGHAVGYLRCPGDCRQFNVYGTPRVPEHHARDIIRHVDACPHGEE